MKDSYFRGLKLVTYLDCASRYVMVAQFFTEATSKNAQPSSWRSQNDSARLRLYCLTMARILWVAVVAERPKRSWIPTTFEAKLLNCGIELINSRPCPQTNDKPERLHGSVEVEIFHYDSLSAYMEYYNERRLHFSLDMDSL